MISSLTEEQRLRMEANRQRALQKKNQRQLESRLASNESLRCNNIPPKIESSVRDSFGDSSIDWNAAVQEMDRIIATTRLQSNCSASHTKLNKRKLDNEIDDVASFNHIKSDLIKSSHELPGSNNQNDANSLTRNDMYGTVKSNNTLVKSQLTEDQKLRMERNRLMALEKKKRAAISSAATLYSTHTEEKSHAIVINTENKVASDSTDSRDVFAHIVPHSGSTSLIDKCDPLSHQRGPTEINGIQSCEANQNSSQRNANCCSSTEKHNILIDRKRHLALQRKQSSLSNSKYDKSDQYSMEVNLGYRQINSVGSLTSDQSTFIDKRIVALEKKQPPYSMPHEASSVAAPLCKHHLSEQQERGSSSFASLSNMEQNQCQRTLRSPSSSIFSDPAKDLSQAKIASQDRYELPGVINGVSGSKKNQSSSATDKQKGSDLPQIPSDIRYEESRCLPIDDGKIDSLIENAQLDKPLLNGWSLYDHQKEGVLRALRMRRLILAFDMGLGKTIIGCVWSKAFLKTYISMKVFVIAPVSLMQDWRQTAKEATGLNAHDGLKKAKKKTKNESSDETDGIDMFIFSWSNVAGYRSITVEHSCDFVVICDEAHNMQSMTSKRTEDVLKLVLSKRCQGALLLSGTPMKNGRPSNLFPLLRAVKHPFGDNQRKYEFYFCNGQQRFINGREVWDASGSSNLKELHAHTSSHIFRMTKDECMSDALSPKKREYLKVPVSSRQELRYNQALKDLAQAFSAMQGTKGAKYTDDNENNILQPFNCLRQASSSAKIDATVALANEILKEEGSIVIFTSFVAVARDVHQKLAAVGWNGQLLTGETVPGKRYEMVDDFQSGVTPVFVCTYGAGGVGLTLTAACTVILIDRPWTPGDVNQAEDRVRRIGQTRPVRSIWIRAFPIDEQIDALLDHKEVNSFTAVDGKEGCGRNLKAPKISISELVKTTLSNQTSS